ncbi:MAG: acyl-CoA/acyl-ACP dehydrogenase [Chloroflexi bacterium]|nr:acyl-CoA/acyl-ACP dehydrogenase [Chloroflexota bacterium]
MDLGLSEQQEMLKKMARDFLVTECPKKLVREMEVDEKGHVPELWRKMAELGWQGLPFPEQYGGGAGSFLDLGVLLEEMGRACLPSPFLPTVVLGGLTILEVGNEAQKQQFLTPIANGEMVMTMALTESSARYDASGIAVEATSSKDHYVISGTKLFVPNAHVADWIVCIARTGKGRNPEDGITLFLVKNESPGVICKVLPSMAKDKQCEVVFNNVGVPAKDVLGEVGRGWNVVSKALQRAAVAKSLEMAGGAQQVLEMTVSYAKERVQFDHPIGTFQAIQHHCANMVIDVDTARYLTYLAASKLSEGASCDMEVAAAKAWTSEAYRRVVYLGHQVHGAIGFTLDHDMQLYSRRAKAAEIAFGDADFHREALARHLEAQSA